MTDAQRADLLALLGGAVAKADRLDRAIVKHSEACGFSARIIASWVIGDLKRGRSLDWVMTWLLKGI